MMDPALMRSLQQEVLPSGASPSVEPFPVSEPLPAPQRTWASDKTPEEVDVSD